MMESDREIILEMMRNFYSSPAVATNGSEEIFTNDIDACVSDNPYLEGHFPSVSIGLNFLEFMKVGVSSSVKR